MSGHGKLRQRLWDLVRHQRAELHGAWLISDAEYAALAADHGSVARLEDYDALRQRAEAAERRVRELTVENEAMRARVGIEEPRTFEDMLAGKPRPPLAVTFLGHPLDDWFALLDELVARYNADTPAAITAALRAATAHAESGEPKT